MGRIFDRFHNKQFHNEAEVSQNFVIPLFTEFLGYTEDEILPERLQPAVKIPRNRDKSLDGDDAKIKPDYMIAVGGDRERIVFSFDSKGPDERLDDHLSQLLAYAISVGVNLVATSNGQEIRVYNANDLVFQAADILSLDLQFNELRKLLHKEVALTSATERIRSLNDDIALGRTVDSIRDEQRKIIAVQNNDFLPYLETLYTTPIALTLPLSISNAFQTPLKHLSAHQLYSFFPFKPGIDLKPNLPRTYSDIIQGIYTTSILIIGESGIGKTSLLNQIAYDLASECLHYERNLVPIFIKLGHYTSTNNIRQLILDGFSGRGVHISKEELNDLLQAGRLLLLCDAYDEVIDKHLHDLQQEIESILVNYKCPIVVTTRHFRLPQLSLLTKYEIAPLSWTKIRVFSEMYLKEGYLDFLNEALSKGLGQLVSNTLLLTLLIFLYQRDQDLPNSQTKILEAIVNQLERWANSKTKRFQQPLSWQTRLKTLSKLAHSSFAKGDLYVIDAEAAEEILVEILSDLKTKHKVSPGTLLDEFYEQLTDTGLVHIQGNNISFWHRAFQEYLASFEIQSRLQSGIIKISDVITVPKWESILPVAAYHSPNSDGMIWELLALNVFTAGRTIIECGQTDGEAYKKTVNCLKEKCLSHHRAIRHLAVNLLKQIGGDFVGSKFRELSESPIVAENCEFEHIQKVALIEIARRKIPNARAIIYSYLDWQSSTRLEWMRQEVHAGASIIEALSWFDDKESQQHIVNRWITKRDMFTRDACRDALIRIANRKGLHSETKSVLFNLILNEQPQQHNNSNIVPSDSGEKFEIDYWGIGSVLIEIHDIDQAMNLIAVLETTDDSEIQAQCIRILKTFDESEVTEALIKRVEHHRINLQICERFLDVLSESGAKVPFEVFIDFVHDPLPTTVKAFAIRGLSAFPFNRIRDDVLSAIHPPSEDQLLENMLSRLIEQALQNYTGSEIIQMITGFANLQGITDEARTYLRDLLIQSQNVSEFFEKLAEVPTSDDVEWSIITNLQNLPSGIIRQIIDRTLLPTRYDILLDDWPCAYARVQNEIFHLLDKHGQIPLLATPKHRPEFLYNISSETLFAAIRRSKYYTTEPYILSLIDKRMNDRQVGVQRTVVEAAWVLADLGNTEKAKEVIDKVLENVDLSKHGHDWILGDILKGIHLLPEKDALSRIETIWSRLSSESPILLPTDCIEALERIGSHRALEKLEQIAQETYEWDGFRAEPERALRAIQVVSPIGREDWLIEFLQKDHEDRHVVQRIIDMLGITGNEHVLPALEAFLNDSSEKFRYVAFWAIHNIHKANNRIWYDDEEVGCSQLEINLGRKM
ncbi:MAG: NACHT domain-containing protein [Ardenticatenaceae bacterium]|nr:NACHT domain-containing protein [Ardenticatenaceae bacterium]